MRKRLVMGAALVLILALLGVGCGGGKTPAPSQQPVQEFVLLVNNLPKNIDPAKASGNPELEQMRAAYETLVEVDPETKELKPVLAKAWQSSPDRSEWTVELREGVKFHDGSTLTAESVKSALERSIKIGAGESYLIASSIQSMEAADSLTLKFQLKGSEPEFIYSLSRIFIPSAEAIKAHDKGDMAQEWLSQNEAGSGPYRMVSWEKEQRLVLEKFPEYWRGWEGKHIDRYVFQVVPEPGTQRLMMERGDGDFADSIVADDAKALESNANLQVLACTGANPMYIQFNPTGPLKDVRVRRAIATAFNYTAMIEDVMKGYAAPLRGPAPEALIGFNQELQQVKYDLEGAKKLLQEAGVKNLKLTYMYFQPWLFEKSAGLMLQEALKDMGMTLEIEAQPWATFVEKVKNPQTRPNMGMVAVYVPSPTVGPLLRTMFHSSSQGHWAYWGYNNPEVDRLLDQAKTEIDDARRLGIYQQIQKLLYDDYAAIWVMNKPDIHVFKKNVKGYQYNPFYPLILNYYGLYKE